MKQILQRLDDGAISVVDVPRPSAGGARLLVRAERSLISAGTERMLLQFGRGSILDKVRSQPDKVRDVVAKMRTDGVAATLDAVRAKLHTPIPLGYCSAGVVEAVGSNVPGFQVGDRVATNGPHAEFVSVPHTLAARIPDGVSTEAAAFTPLAAIALQGIRLANPLLGETVVVFGLGLVGLLAVQLLRANGCRVIGIDRSPGRLQLGERFGAIPVDARADNVTDAVLELTGGVGADAVLLTLASDSDEPVRQAADMSRVRGRIVLVGVTGLALSRDAFYRKELSFQVSCSYGPGRYDPQYEDQGQDYPIGYVRWTEQRNFGAVLDLMARGSLDPLPLVTHAFDVADATRAYDAVASDASAVGVVLRYPEPAPGAVGAGDGRIIVRAGTAPSAGAAAGGVVAGVIGAGNFSLRVLLPAMRRAGVRLRTIASAAGTSAAIAGERHGFEQVTTDLEAIFGDPLVNTVFVLTRHDSHAALVQRALAAGKHVFVEKPLALHDAELDAIAASYAQAGRQLMVGFNRRFAPLTGPLRELLARRAGPAALVMTVNAGAIPRSHWTQDLQVGGGRIVGEACHFLDLARHLVGHPIRTLQVAAAADRDGHPVDDIAAITLTFVDGSIATIHYVANGARSFPKERIECFVDGRVAVIDNWRRGRGFGVRFGTRGLLARQDKGHDAQIAAWTAAVAGGGEAPIPADELFEVARWSIVAAAEARGVASAAR